MFRLIITATLALLISACSMQVYKLEVQQGNIVTEDMLNQLKPGMNKRQVSYVMGNPVLKDTFTTQHWDYIYRVEREPGDAKDYKVRVFFDAQGKYSHYEGNTELKLIKKAKS